MRWKSEDTIAAIATPAGIGGIGIVRLSADLYELRRVETRTASENLTAVTAGLSDRDLVAVEQSYLLKSEFQKSRLGAGCVD